MPCFFLLSIFVPHVRFEPFPFCIVSSGLYILCLVYVSFDFTVFKLELTLLFIDISPFFLLVPPQSPWFLILETLRCYYYLKRVALYYQRQELKYYLAAYGFFCTMCVFFFYLPVRGSFLTLFSCFLNINVSLQHAEFQSFLLRY